MAKLLQTNFTSGVIDPKLAAREDIVFYYNGLKDAKNLLIIPEGGAIARPGKQFVRKLSKTLSVINLSSATATAPEGGIANNVKDGDEATVLTTSNNVSTTNPFVVAHIDLGSAMNVAAVDVVNYKLSSLSLSGEFYVQTSPDNSAWSNFGTAFDWDASARSRRLRQASGPVSARYIRVARIGATSVAATAHISEIRVWSQSNTLSEGKLFPFAYATEQAYMFVASDRNIDVLKGVDYHGSISIPHLSAQLPVVNYTQSLDTMILFHKNVAPFKIFRQGGDDEFDWRKYPFKNIPQYDYGAGTGGANEVQVLNDGGTVSSGDKFTILLEGNRTTTITAGATRALTAAAIETALRALSNTSSSGITVADASGLGFTVTFGGDDGLKPWLEMGVSVMTGTSVWSISRTTKGRLPGEDIMSDARGYPRTGAFHQSRLHMAGFLGVPDAYVASVLDEYTNLDTELDDATKALLERAETDQVSAIYQILVGRHLSFFTNDGEFYIPSEKIDPEISLRWTTDAGSKEGMRVHRVEGGLMFIQGVKDANDDAREIGTSIREFIFEETLQAYKTNLLSKLSSHLIKNPVDVTLRKSIATADPNLLVVVNEDGSAANYTVLREDDVNAIMPMALRSGDKIKAAGVDKKRRVYFITERIINGAAERFVEVWNENLYLDCGGIVTIEAQNVTAAANDQAAYVWSFTNPGTPAAIGVRINGGRLAAEEYTVDLGTKTVTLSADRAGAIVAGDVVRIAKMVNEVEGLSHLEGETIQTFIDGTPGNSYEITGGVLSLDDYADTEIQYGFEFEVSGELMPLRIPESETLATQKVGVVNIILNLFETVGIELKANGSDWFDVPLQKMDDAVLDRSAEEMLFTGEAEAQGLLGAEVGAPVLFRRPQAGPFTLLGIARDVREFGR